MSQRKVDFSPKNSEGKLRMGKEITGVPNADFRDFDNVALYPAISSPALVRANWDAIGDGNPAVTLPKFL
jgi:hypothetical protein